MDNQQQEIKQPNEKTMDAISETMLFLSISNSNSVLTPSYVKEELSNISEYVVPFAKKECLIAYLRFIITAFIQLGICLIIWMGYNNWPLLGVFAFALSLNFYFHFDCKKQMEFFFSMKKHEFTWQYLKKLPEEDFMFYINAANEARDEKTNRVH